MANIVQLSDLHLDPGSSGQHAILDSLVTVLERRFAGMKREADVLVITGDVFDTSSLPEREATESFVSLHDRILAALGGRARTVIVPGNHDRRRKGLLGPHGDMLFSALRRTLGKRAYVHGCDVPFLAGVVPRAVHGLPMSFIAYDSTYLPSGLISAGGIVRQEDLLRAGAQIEADPPDDPLLFVLHHHLVPTPLTDVGSIDLASAAGVLRWAVQRLLPRLISNADREELTMTALGSGTALSTLHEFGRAVLVLHGHKHYATARLLRGMVRTQGDVLIVSAGSAGTAEPWSPTTVGDVARLWPSFNLLETNDGELRVETVSFGYKGSSKSRCSQRSLVRARQAGATWEVEPVALEPSEQVGPRLLLNRSECTLSPCSSGRPRWDYTCKRQIVSHGDKPRRYAETIEGIVGAKVFVEGASAATHAVPARLALEVGGTTRYRLNSGVCRTVEESERVYGRRASPYEWLGIMNRYACDETTLVVEGLGDEALHAFGSATDLGTGIEQPLKLVRLPGRLEATLRNCPARTLLRIYWPLAR
ncbi:MAG: metallophosphoesterase [Polyangiaceae bacterium]|nr:metallophosphoesterase [Polyangiaceae bacterium]